MIKMKRICRLFKSFFCFLRDERIVQPEAYLFKKTSFKSSFCSDTMIETELKTVFFISSLEYNSNIMVFIPVESTLLYSCSNFLGLL